MIVYFADRAMNIVGHASDAIGNSIRIANDTCTQEVEHGSETLTFDLYFQPTTRAQVEDIASVGNYVLRYTGEKDNYKLYTIIDSELNVNDRRINVYAEDGGLDLLNETAGPFEPSTSLTIADYINKYINDTGFKIGKNEIGTSTKKLLTFDSDETVTKRLLNIASNFDAELTYSYTINRLKVTGKFVDIYKKIGSNKEIELRTNREIDNIVVKKSIANLCTGIYPIGSSPDGSVGYVSGRNSEGKTTYTWIMFSDSANGAEGMENSLSSHNFIGIATGKTKHLESENYKDYKWYRAIYNSVKTIPDGTNRILLRTGDNKEGEDPWGVPDSDSEKKYDYIRFADDEYGTNMSTSRKGKKYIGIATNKGADFTESKDGRIEANDPDNYNWDVYAGYDSTTLYVSKSDNRLGDGRYCHWVYGDSADGMSSMYSSPRHHNYVGFACTYSSTAPQNANEYIWSKITDNPAYNSDYAEYDWSLCGLREFQEDGKTPATTYTWLRFAKDLENLEVLTTPKSARYIGISYHQERINPTTSSWIYQWYDITGGNDKITLDGYSYDKGDIYVKDGTVYTRKGIEKWTRYRSASESLRTAKGAIVRRISYNEGDPDELVKLAIKDLEKYSEPEVNYEVTVKYLPENVFLGDKVNVVDDAGLLYVQARILKIERSETNDTTKVTFGDFLIRDSGISSETNAAAANFAAYAASRQVSYTWTAYADDDQGTNISTEAEGKAYIGIANNMSTRTPVLNDPLIFTWSKIQGKDGDSAVTVQIRSSNGDIFNNTALVTVLSLEVYEGTTQLTDEQVLSKYNIKWYLNGALVSGESGINLTVNNQVDSKLVYSVELDTKEE